MTQSKYLYDSKVGFYQHNDIKEDIELVYPNPKPEEETIELGLLDRRQPNIWVPITVVIDNKDGKLTYEILKSGLELALGQYPYFAGRVIDRSSVRYSDAWFSRADSDTDFKVDDKFNVVPGEFQFTKAIDVILESETIPAPVFAAKATFVKDNCVVLTTLTSHYIGDGQTISDFIRLWAKYTSTEEPISLKPIIKPDPVEVEESPLYVPDMPTDHISMLSFKISLEKLKTIQININKYTTNFVSKEDVFLAMLWKIFIKAREVTSESLLSRAVSIHSRKEHNLGLGNKYISTMTSLLSIDELNSKSIEELARIIRDSIPAKDTKLPPGSFKRMTEVTDETVKFYSSVGVTSHRMFYDPPISFHHQLTHVHTHLTYPYFFIIQPTDNQVMFATLGVHHPLVPKILSSYEVVSYGIDVTVNPIS